MKTSARGRLTALVVAGLAAAAFVGWVAWTALDEDDPGVAVGDLVDDPDRYVGRTVTISGEISAVLSANAVFVGGETLAGDGAIPGGRSVLVVSDDLRATTPRGEQVVRATGEVRILDDETLEREFGIEDEFLDDEFETPALVDADVSVEGG